MLDEVNIEGVQRNGRDIVDMVYEELDEADYDTDSIAGSVQVSSMSDDLTVTGIILDSEDGIPSSNYEVSIGVENLESDDVEAYLNEFYDADEDDSLTVWGTRGGRSMNQIEQWSDDEGERKSFYLMFDSDPVDHPEGTGLLHLDATIDGRWDNPAVNTGETVGAMNTALHEVERPELSNERIGGYWQNVFEPSTVDKLRGNLSIGSDPETPYEKVGDLPDIEFDNPDDVMPTTTKLIDIRNELHSRGWQVDIGNMIDFNTTAHTLKARGSTQEEFTSQMNWIEDRLNVPKDTEFDLRNDS